jgi:hypothetical protein
MPPVGFEHAISAGERPQTCVLDRAATGTGRKKYYYENNQQNALYGLIYCSKSALHVSGDVFAHHQEHLTVFTVSGSVHPSCCLLVPAVTWVNTSRYCKYSQVLFMMGENIAGNM